MFSPKNIEKNNNIILKLKMRLIKNKMHCFYNEPFIEKTKQKYKEK